MVMIVLSSDTDKLQKKKRVKKSHRKSHNIGLIKFEKPEKITVILCSILTALMIAFILILFDSGLGSYKGVVMSRDSGEVSNLGINGDITGDIALENDLVLSNLPPEIVNDVRFETSLKSANYERNPVQSAMLTVPSDIGETWFLNNSLSKFITADAHLTPTEKLFNIDQ